MNSKYAVEKSLSFVCDCGEKHTFTEYLEPFINEPALAICRCEECGKYHYICTRNNSYSTSSKLEYLLDNYSDDYVEKDYSDKQDEYKSITGRFG